MKHASIWKTSTMSTTVQISAPLLRVQTRNVELQGNTIDRQERKDDRREIGGTMKMRLLFEDVDVNGMVERDVAGSSGEETIEIELDLAVSEWQIGELLS